MDAARAGGRGEVPRCKVFGPRREREASVVGKAEGMRVVEAGVPHNRWRRYGVMQQQGYAWLIPQALLRESQAVG